jgi:hypothetical protein
LVQPVPQASVTGNYILTKRTLLILHALGTPLKVAGTAIITALKHTSAISIAQLNLAVEKVKFSLFQSITQRRSTGKRR